MSENNFFCENCRSDTETIIKNIKTFGEIRSKKYYYTGKTAYCSKCNSEIYVSEIVDYNLKELYDVYRKENDIISLRRVQEIPTKYSIDIQNISLLLGWSEQTFSRYFDGDVPTKQCSIILSRIYNDPSYYLELLENNKGNLKSRDAYEKSRKAVEMLLCRTRSENSKINDVIRYLLNYCKDITPLALQKALYYIQGFYFAFYKSFIFSEDCEAWRYGPVYRDVYFQYKNYHFDPIMEASKFNLPEFSSSEKAICDSIIDNVCCYSGNVLINFTHNEMPWIVARGNIPVNTPSKNIIDKSVIGDYFSAVKKKYNMINVSDIKQYTYDMFLKTK